MFTKRCLTALLVILCFGVGLPKVNAQLFVSDTLSDWELAQSLVGTGVSISNVNISCDPLAYGSFDGTNTNLGINKGVVLTSGHIANIPGQVTNSTSDNHTPNQGDVDLEAIINSPGNTNDACIMEFDIEVDADTLKFNYVFASHEYDTYVCSNFNDVFAFMITGPNPGGGAYTNYNTALIPGTALPVAINSVNNGTVGGAGTVGGCISLGYSNLFIENDLLPPANTTISYNGFTTVFTATLPVVPCQTYHMKLAIADVFDQALDSGVFLEAGSFISTAITLESNTSVGQGFANAIEDCVDGIFTFNISEAQTDTFAIHYQIAGTATNGVDYVQIPDSVLLLPGDTSVNLVIDPTLDAITEGLESVTLYLINGCNGLPYDSATIWIQDSVAAVAASPDDTICRGEIVQVSASGGLFYDWSPGIYASDSTIANPILQPDSSMLFTVEVEVGTCSDVDSLYIEVVDANFSVDVGPDDTICLNEAVQFNGIITGNQGPYQSAWSPGAGLTDSTILNPVASPAATTNYALTVIGQNGCEIVDFKNIVVAGAGPVVIASADPLAVCPGDTIQLDVLSTPQSCGINNGPCSGSYTTNSILVNSTTFPSSVTAYPSIYGGWDPSAKHQILYRASDLNAAGILGGTISEIAFNVLGVNSTNYNNFTISMGCTQLNQLADFEGGLTQVMNPTNITVVAGWNNHILDNAYDWDGSSNLIIEVCFTNAAGFNFNNFMSGTNPGYTAMAYTSGASACNTASGASTSTVRPDIQFTYCQPSLAGYNIDWSPGSLVSDSTIANPIAFINQTTTFNITASDAFCQGSGFVTVQLDSAITLDVGPDTTICSASPVQLYVNIPGNPMGVTYNWSPGNLVSDSTIANPFFTGSNPAVLTVEVTSGSCSASGSVNLNVGGLGVTLNPTQLSCPGSIDGQIISNVSSVDTPFVYSWSNGMSTADLINISSGTYVLTVSDANGCTGVDSATIDSIAPFNIVDSTSNISCFGAQDGYISVAVSGGTGVIQYDWNDIGLGSGTRTNLSAGTYSVIYSDGSGCGDTLTYTITEPAELIVSIIDTQDVLCSGDTTGALTSAYGGGVGPYNLVWSTGDADSILTGLSVGTYSLIVIDAQGCMDTASGTVNELNPIVLTVGSDSVSCPGMMDGLAYVSATGGAGNFLVSWDGSVGSDTLFFASEGWHYVDVIDGNGCMVSDSIQVLSPAAMNLEGTSRDISCHGLTDGMVRVNVQSGGTGPFQYDWSGLGNLDSLSGIGAGTYTVVVTDANGCQDSLTLSIVEPDSVQVSIVSAQNVSCFGNADGSIQISVTGGTGGYTYNWSNMTTDSNATALDTGVYTVTVMDANGCAASASAGITQPPALSIMMSADSLSCFGSNDGIATALVSGGVGDYNYSWSSSPSNTMTANGLSAGAIQVTVTDSLGCQITGGVNVDQPAQIILSTGKMDVTCNGYNDGLAYVNITSGGSGPFNYSWSNASQNDSILGLGQGMVTVTVTDNNLCTATSTITVNEPSPIVVSLSIDPIACAGNSDGAITANGSGGSGNLNYIWSNGDAGNTISNLSAGSYVVTVQDANGCTVTNSAALISPSSLQFLGLFVDSASCPGSDDGSLILSAAGGTQPISYTNDGVNYQAEPIFTNLAPGVYELQAQDANGCSIDTTVVVFEPAQLNVAISPIDSVVQLGEMVQLIPHIFPHSWDQIDKISWSPANGLSCLDCQQPFASSYNHVNDYTLTLEFGNNCISQASVTVYVENNLDVYIPNAFTPNGDGFNDIFQVYGTGLKSVTMQVFDRWGEKVYEGEAQRSGWTGMYKGEFVEPGVYIYMVEATYLDNKRIERRGSVTVLR